MRAVAEASRVPACWLEISSAVSQSRAPERSRASSLPAASRSSTRPRVATTRWRVAGVLHDLQVAALSGRFDAKEHAATDYDTALMPRTTAASQAYPADFVCWRPVIGRHVAPHCRKYIRQIAGKCLELLTLKRGQVNLLSNSSLGVDPVPNSPSGRLGVERGRGPFQ